MNSKGIHNAIIVGAGFSRHAGLPLQSDFTEALLEPRHQDGHKNQALVQDLSLFVHDAFDHNVDAKSAFWPDLEDIFTSIDLSANAGHHLGSKYPPKELRKLRRALIARIIWMLDERFNNVTNQTSREFQGLSEFFKKVDSNSTAFICMNWDTVIEQMIQRVKRISSFNYGCAALPASFPKKVGAIKREKKKTDLGSLRIVKMHGSTNWLYCDNCRQLYWFDSKDSPKIAKQLYDENNPSNNAPYWECPECTGVRLTTRMATFSYLKALDFPMFQRSWLTAEDILRNARKWVFIGYSLPAADYEFKHLLKRIQVSRNKEPDFVVVTKGHNNTDTYHNYQRFFGRGIRKRENFFEEGLDVTAIEAALT